MSNVIIETARKEVGTIEGKGKKNKYAEWYDDGKYNGFSWCAMFVSWVFDQADTPLPAINDPDGFRYCPSLLNWAKSPKEYHITHRPEPGDIILFDWNVDGKADHTGIFVSWANPEKTKLNTIEGNTMPGNDSNGGRVMERVRNISMVQAFVSPFKVIPRYVVKGDRGYLVKQAQRQLVKLFGYHIAIDGDFGGETETIVKHFQKRMGLKEDGEIGEKTLSMLKL